MVDYSNKSFIIVAQEEMNPFKGPQKPTRPDKKPCSPGFKKDPKTGHCIKEKGKY